MNVCLSSRKHAFRGRRPFGQADRIWPKNGVRVMPEHTVPKPDLSRQIFHSAKLDLGNRMT